MIITAKPTDPPPFFPKQLDLFINVKKTPLNTIKSTLKIPNSGENHFKN